MAFWHGYLLLVRPTELTSGNWTTIKNYLDNSGILNETPSASQPSEQWHVLTPNADAILAESTFETTELTSAALAAHYSAALGGTPDAATIEGYIDDPRKWQAFASGTSIGVSRETAANHVKLYGYVPKGPRVSAGDTYYVATTGSALNDGSIGSPWTLAHVLSGAAGVQQKDTVYLRGGLYSTTTDYDAWECNISGYENEPIILRAYPVDWIAGSYPILQPGINVNYPYVRFWGVVVTGEQANRFHADYTSTTPGTVSVLAPFVECVNVVTHNGDGSAIGAQSKASGFLFYGGLVHNGGFSYTDSTRDQLYDTSGNRIPEDNHAHGHGTYLQNDGAFRQLVRHGIFFNMWGSELDIHGTGSVQAKNIDVEQTVVVNGQADIGYYEEQDDLVFDGVQTHALSFALGSYDGSPNAVVQNSVLYRQGNPIQMIGVENGTFSNNQVVADGGALLIKTSTGDSFATLTADNNDYYQINYTGISALNESFATWQARGFDANGTYTAALPTGVDVYIYANEYQDGNDPREAIIVVRNWESATSVNLNLSSLSLVNGNSYKLINAFDYAPGDTVDVATTWTSDGTDSAVAVNMEAANRDIAKPLGYWQTDAMGSSVTFQEPIEPTPYPMFGVFILERSA